MQQSAVDDSPSKRALAAIGSDGTEDYILKPTEHAAALGPEAGPLKRILSRPEISAIASAYETYDNEAKRWQGLHVRWGKRGIWASLLAVACALTLTVAPLPLSPLQNVLASVFVWSLVCFAWGCFIYLTRWRPQKVWQTARANAEEMRKRLFEAVLAADETAGPDEIPALPLQLEYFRRYQYDVQHAYYKKRAGEGRARAAFADNVRYVAGLVPFVALALTLAAAFSASSEQGVASPALDTLGRMFHFAERLHIDSYGIAAAVAVSALAAGLFAIAQLDDYRRNSDRYQNTLRAIEEIADDPRRGFVKARAAADRQERLPIERLVRNMHAVMSAELAEWVTIKRDARPLDDVATMADRGSPMWEFRITSDGATDFIAASKLGPADFEAIAARIGAPVLSARRIGFVAARQATAETPVHTRWNGKEADDVARVGDWIVTNMSPEREFLRDSEKSLNTYVIRAEKFPQLYDLDQGETEHGAIYRSKSVVRAILLPGSFELVPPWGGIQRGATGYLLLNGEEVYGNNRETFEATYEV